MCAFAECSKDLGLLEGSNETLGSSQPGFGAHWGSRCVELLNVLGIWDPDVEK